MDGASSSGGCNTSSTSCLMGFGDVGGSVGGLGLSPLMIVPLMASPPLLPKPNGATTTNTDGNEGGNLLYPNSNIDGGANAIKAKIMSHPYYPRLLSAYINCHKVGAPPDVVARLEGACAIGRTAAGSCHGVAALGEDPALDQFMEAYCEMLGKYEEELNKPFKEAMLFLSRVESQFKSLTLNSAAGSTAPLLPQGCDADIAEEKNMSSEDDIDAVEAFIDPQADDSELKGQLLRKYSGYLGSLKKEFLKKRKKGKLPKEARQQLLDWWTRHYKWPYPSESQKLALAESTGLDQKQINNWFINQRKRHWKPSEEMQFVVMDAAHPTHYYMDSGFGNPFSVDCGGPAFY